MNGVDERADSRTTYRLTTMQAGMLATHMLEQGTGVDVTQIVVDVHEELSVERLRAAWREVLCRHEALRSCIAADDPSLQRVSPSGDLSFAVVDWRNMSPEVQEDEWRRFLDEDRRRGIDILSSPTFRIAVIRRRLAAWQVVWTLHHAFMDGASAALVLAEVFAAYDGRAPAPAALAAPAQFADYVRWADRQDTARTEAHWRSYLSGAVAPTSLPFGRRAAKLHAASYRELECRVSVDAAEAVRALTGARRITVNTVLQAAWGLVLARHARADEVLLGSVRSGRQVALDGVERIVGPLIFNVPVRIHVAWRESTREWLEALRAEQRRLPERELAPFAPWQRFVDSRGGEAPLSSLTVFDNQSFGDRVAPTLGGKGTRSVRVLRQPGFGISVAGSFDDGGALALRLNYYADVLLPDEAEVVLGHLRCAFEQLVDSSVRRVEEVDLAPATERQRVLSWSKRQDAGTGIEPPTSITAAIEERAAHTPNAVAVVAGREQMTYAELDRRANQIAHLLRRRGVGRGALVGAALARDVSAPATLLGILKAGAAYVPIDPAYPPDRLRCMVEESGAGIVLGSGRDANLSWAEGLTATLDLRAARAEIDAAPATAVGAPPRHLDAAYLIFTSGSTGKPKGVLVTHHNVMRLIQRIDPLVDLAPDDRWLATHSVSFDFSVWEIWGALTTGGRVVLASEDEMRSPSAVWSLVRSAGITILSQTPSFFYHLMADALADVAVPSPLRLVVFGGESLSAAKIRPWVSRVGTALPRLVNMYGITETTVHVTYAPLDDEPETTGASDIGRPLADLDAFVLDTNGRPTAIGVPGEICVGGAGVAVGYWRQSAHTAARFIPHPQSDRPGERLYRSGDLAYYDARGRLRYLGRGDRQLKIRGFRIEPGEIEGVIATDERVRTVCVAVRTTDADEPMLVAYVVPRDVRSGQPATRLPEAFADDLRRRVTEHLPRYCIPSAFVALSALPLTRNGKVDVAALLRVDTEAPDHVEDALPAGPVETLLATVWETILERAPVRATDDFFELGGHSILAARAAARLESLSGVRIPLTYFFESPVLRDFAHRVLRDTAMATPLTELGVALAQARALMPASAADNEGRSIGDGGVERQPRAERGFDDAPQADLDLRRNVP